MNRRTMLIAGAVAVGVLALWYFLLWGPRKADLSAAKERRDKAESLRNELVARVTRLKASQKDEPAKRAQLEALRTTIPDDPNLAAFILDTNDAASKAGIDWISIAPSEPTAATTTPGSPARTSSTAATATTGDGTAPAGGLPAEIKLNLQITGGYFQVLDFMNRLNDMPRLVVTDSVTVNSDDKAKLTVALGARMFVRTVPPGYGDVPALTTPATPAPSASTAPAAATTNVSTPAAATPPPTASAAPAASAQPTGARS